MGTHFDLAMIEQAFVEAAVDPTKWNHAMNVTSAATDCFGALLFDSKTRAMVSKVRLVIGSAPVERLDPRNQGPSVEVDRVDVGPTTALASFVGLVFV